MDQDSTHQVPSLPSAPAGARKQAPAPCTGRMGRKHPLSDAVRCYVLYRSWLW